MSIVARVRRLRAPPFLDPPGYVRHRPESTLLYQLVEQHYPAFRELRAETGRALPFLLATNSAALTQVLGVVYRTIARHLIGKAGLTRTRAGWKAKSWRFQLVSLRVS